ncbi:MAG: hypothetical protein HYT71_00600 [Candidatus Aenigmarchaeota archaeon]|nr:hypothetical protein [Candidatus Aenigmarchaeota archaeon]
MRIVYTAQPIEGIVESRHPPVATLIAKETLKAVVEEDLMKRGVVTSYTIADDNQFPFPFEKPNVIDMDGFFGPNPDFNLIASEVTELFEQPQREYADFQAKLEAELKTATDSQILEMVERFHYTQAGTRKKYEDARDEVGRLWKPYGEIKGPIESLDYNPTGHKLMDALKTIDDIHAKGLIRDLDETRKLLKSGYREKAKEKVMFNYRNWRRKNLAALENACGDAKFYGAGFWIARLVAPDEDLDPLKMGYPEWSRPPVNAEQALRVWRMPYQTIQMQPAALRQNA